MNRLRNLLVLMRVQIWLLPALMGIAALVLAWAMLRFGAGMFVDPRGTRAWWLFSGDAGTARDLMSTLLSGLMTMTSLVVSMTFVVLTLAAQQLGPRLVSIFTSDRQIQAVLGLFLGTILYTLVVLRSFDGALGSEGVPHLAVSLASFFTFLCLLSLLFYVHKIAGLLVSDTVVRRVADELRRATDDLLPEMEPPERAPAAHDLPPHACWIALGRSGYVQTIDYDALVAAARELRVVLRVHVRAGHFVLASGPHVEVLGNAVPESDAQDLAHAVRAAFVVGGGRRPTQDLEYFVRQLVETGLRALSPGVKDPFTAMAVIDQLGAALERVLSRPAQPVLIADDEGAPRVLADRSDREGLVDAAFDQIRQAGSDDPAVLIHLADTLGRLARACTEPDAQRVLEAHLDRLAEAAEATLDVPVDRAAVQRRIASAREAFRAS